MFSKQHEMFFLLLPLRCPAQREKSGDLKTDLLERLARNIIREAAADASRAQMSRNVLSISIWEYYLSISNVFRRDISASVCRK